MSRVHSPRPRAVRIVALTAASLGSLAIAACSESSNPVAPKPADSRQSSQELNNVHRHLFRTKPWFEADRATSRSAGTTNTGIYYHGGPLLTSQTNVAAVYWGSSRIYTNAPAPGSTGTGSGDGSLIGTFLRGLGGSPYFNINTTYYDGSGTHVANKVSYTQFWANNSYNVPSNGQSVSDAQMLAMLQYAFNNGKLTYDPSTLYAIFTAGTVNLGGGFGSQYCAYHGSGTVTVGGTSRVVLYAAMPYDNAYPGICTNGTPAPNGSYDPGADAEVNTLAHETEETTTDKLLNAWYDHRGQENADKCAWTFGTTYTTSSGGTANMTIGGVNFLVQRNWVNAGSGGCALKY